MNSVVLSKNYEEPPFRKREILRYAGCKTADGETEALLDSCINEIKEKLNLKVCYCRLPVRITGNLCDFTFFSLQSENLSLNLKDCEEVILFAATVGVETDRLISRYSRISPARALMFQAIGAERIEALCDTFCEDISKETGLNLRPRFSPGYGDLPLGIQKEIFSLLDCSKRIGLSLNDSMLMSPTKSVTAFAGLYSGEKEKIKSKCSACDKKDCSFRGAL